jgi:porin
VFPARAARVRFRRRLGKPCCNSRLSAFRSALQVSCRCAVKSIVDFRSQIGQVVSTFRTGIPVSKQTRPFRKAAFSLSIVLLLAAGAIAQEDKKTDDDKPADPDTGESTVEEKAVGLLPNPLQKYGVKFAATYIGEVLGNASGGLKQGSVYEGRLNLAVDVDLQKLVGLDKLTFHANMFQIHGDGLSRSNLQNFFTVSGIEALPSTRLYEAFFEKQWGAKKVSLKIRPARCG